MAETLYTKLNKELLWKIRRDYKKLRCRIFFKFLAKMFCLIHWILAIKTTQRRGRTRNSGLKWFHRTKYLLVIKGHICLKLTPVPSVILFVQPLVLWPGVSLLYRAIQWKLAIISSILFCAIYTALLSHAIISYICLSFM